MSITKDVFAGLKSLYDEGMTQEQLSKKYGISQGHVCNIINGKRSVDSMRVSTLLKLFPETSINLAGSAPSAGMNPIENKIVQLIHNLSEDDQLEALMLLSSHFGVRRDKSETELAG